MTNLQEIAKVTKAYLFNPEEPTNLRSKSIAIDKLIQAYDNQTIVMTLSAVDESEQFSYNMVVLPEDLPAALKASVDCHYQVTTTDMDKLEYVRDVYDSQSNSIQELDPAEIAQKTDQDLLIYDNPSLSDDLPVDIMVVSGQEAAFEKAFPQFKRAESTHDWRYYLI